MLRKCALLVMLLALGLALAAPAAQAGPAHIHFLVVAPTPAPGMSPVQAMANFRQALLDLAGGYTEWGPSQGAVRQKGGVHREGNFSYIVAATRDLTPELVALIKKYSDADQPFVLHWTGESNFPLVR